MQKSVQKVIGTAHIHNSGGGGEREKKNIFKTYRISGTNQLPFNASLQKSVCHMTDFFKSRFEHINIASWSLTLREKCRLRAFENREAEKNIWTQDGRSGGRLEKTA
jgi:hypothetical protein